MRRASALEESVGAATPSSGVFGGGISDEIGEDRFLYCGEEKLMVVVIRPKPVIPVETVCRLLKIGGEMGITARILRENWN